jgi:hypothetical protein
MEMVIRFDDCYKSDGFDEGIQVINKLLKPYDLKIKCTTEDFDIDDGTEDYVWEVEVEEIDEKN